VSESREPLPLADEFSAFVMELAGDTLNKSPALRARFSRLYRRLSEIDERKRLAPRRGR